MLMANTGAPRCIAGAPCVFGPGRKTRAPTVGTGTKLPASLDFRYSQEDT
jgi:hypothetical protein